MADVMVVAGESLLVWDAVIGETVVSATEGVDVTELVDAVLFFEVAIGDAVVVAECVAASTEGR